MRRLSRKTTFIAALVVVSAATVLGGWWISPSIIEPYQDERAQQVINMQQIDDLFQRAVQQMLDKDYSSAADTWSRLLVLQPNLPEAHVNLGFSLLELGQSHRACEHFDQASNINRFQINAYYGLAACLEAEGDLRAALGAMRAYTHLADPNDPFMRKANAAIWEWETRLSKSAAQQDSETTHENAPPTTDQTGAIAPVEGDEIR
jgi:tetratricopeptide (TPR) repeat protein